MFNLSSNLACVLMGIKDTSELAYYKNAIFNKILIIFLSMNNSTYIL